MATTAHPRYRAPRRNREILTVPAFDALPRLIDENRRRLDAAGAVVDGAPLGEFRSRARREILALADWDEGSPDGPLLLSGHQPELSHPGVWVKNFALNGLARRVRGIPLNLIVDTDTLKGPALRLPVFHSEGQGARGEGRDSEGDGVSGNSRYARQGDSSLAPPPLPLAPTVRLESLPFDLAAGESPYEKHPIRDPELFRTFSARAAGLTANWGFEPLLSSVWRESGTIDDAFIAMRRKCEEAWGCRNRELRVSRLSQTEAFGRFARHILRDLTRFRDVYNHAIHEYRRANGIRSQSHPAPDLSTDEAPFWEQHGSKRRRASPASDVRALRPRALTLTLFARVCLGDLFIHGIGGGKYDEVTDRIIRDYFEIEPPAFQVLSATLFLPLPSFPASREDVAAAERRLRELQWQPERCLPPDLSDDPAVKQLQAEKEGLILSEPSRTDHPGRRRWFHALQETTDRLRSLVANQVPAAEAAAERTRTEVRANEILRRRDYAWVFYPSDVLRPFLQQFLSGS